MRCVAPSAVRRYGSRVNDPDDMAPALPNDDPGPGAAPSADGIDELVDYRALVAKVDAFARGVTDDAGEALTCAPGCDGCCMVSLTVSVVEAASISRALEHLSEAERGGVGSRIEAGGCALLDGRGLCTIYGNRPLVCRTQGLALRYGGGADRRPVHCHLNYRSETPDPAHVLDADRVDALLGVINHRFAVAKRRDPLVRRSLTEIATGALACPSKPAR